MFLAHRLDVAATVTERHLYFLVHRHATVAGLADLVKGVVVKDGVDGEHENVADRGHGLSSAGQRDGSMDSYDEYLHA
jgi:hypothetical protein